MSKTFGRTSTTSNHDECYANYKRGGRYYLSEAGTITTITALLGCKSGGFGNWRGILYADSGGVPGALLGETAEGTVPDGSAKAKRSLTLVTPYSGAAGYYWLMVHTENGQLNIYRDTSGGDGGYDADTYSGGASDPSGTLEAHTNSNYCIYGTYEGPNVAPNAPALVQPIDGQTVVLSQPYLFKWTFSDSNTGDTQSGYQLRYRPLLGTWTTGAEVTSVSSQATISGGTFTADYYEWQCRTKDKLGLWGPWSTSDNFTAADAADAPIITAPTTGSTVSDAVTPCEWTVADEEYWRFRRVADNSGDPDDGTIYEDTEDTAGTDRTFTPTLSVTGRWEHWQVQVTYGVVVSEWGSSRVYIDYDAPATPYMELSADEDTGTVSVYHEDGNNGPTILYHEIWRSEEDGPFIRAASGLVPYNGDYADWLDYQVAAGKEYTYFVRAVADSGAASDSNVDSIAVDFIGTYLALASDPTNQIDTKAYAMSGTESKSGEFRQFAGGVVRLITRPGGLGSVNVYIKAASREMREALNLWTGELLIYRDGRGRLLYGSYLAVEANEIGGDRQLCDLAFNFVAITHSAEV